MTPVAAKATEPAGVVAPAPLVSATVAVQVEGWLTATEDGEQTTVVDVVRSVPVTEPLAAPLSEIPVFTTVIATVTRFGSRSLSVRISVSPCLRGELRRFLTNSEASWRAYMDGAGGVL